MLEDKREYEFFIVLREICNGFSLKSRCFFLNFISNKINSHEKNYMPFACHYGFDGLQQ